MTHYSAPQKPALCTLFPAPRLHPHPVWGALLSEQIKTALGPKPEQVPCPVLSMGAASE